MMMKMKEMIINLNTIIKENINQSLKLEVMIEIMPIKDIIELEDIYNSKTLKKYNYKRIAKPKLNPDSWVINHALYWVLFEFIIPKTNNFNRWQWAKELTYQLQQEFNMEYKSQVMKIVEEKK